MATKNISLLLVASIFFAYAACDAQSREWCVVAPGASDADLKGVLMYACSSEVVDCSVINPGGACFEPDLLRSHAAYALNHIYRLNGYCQDDVGILVINDPSYGNCHYL